MARWPLVWSVCVGQALTSAGCGKDAPRLVPVAGTVTVAEQPIPAGSIQFRADVTRGNNSMEVPVGVIQPDGRFELSTGGKKGAPAGWWKVVVHADNFQMIEPPPSPVWPLFPEGWQPPKTLVHERYLNPGTSDVSVEIRADDPSHRYEVKLNP
jgi:hypothetical protein